MHGGLRYLEHMNQWGLVHEALHERTLLLRLLAGLVKPLPFVLPNFHGNKRPPWMIRLGLFLRFTCWDYGLQVQVKLVKKKLFYTLLT